MSRSAKHVIAAEVRLSNSITRVPVTSVALSSFRYFFIFVFVFILNLIFLLILVVLVFVLILLSVQGLELVLDHKVRNSRAQHSRILIGESEMDSRIDSRIHQFGLGCVKVREVTNHTRHCRVIGVHKEARIFSKEIGENRQSSRARSVEAGRIIRIGWRRDQRQPSRFCRCEWVRINVRELNRCGSEFSRTCKRTSISKR